MRSLIRSLGVSSCSDSPYSCITFQLQSSAQICHRMVSSTAFRTKAQVVSHSRCSNTRFLCCSFYIRNWSNNHEHWWHDWLGRWRCHRRSCCGGGKAISLTTHPPYHSCRLRWKRFLPSCSWATAISEFTICRLQKMQTVCRLWRLCTTGKRDALCPRYYPIHWWRWKSIWWQMRMRPILLFGQLTTRHQPTSRSTRYGPNNIYSAYLFNYLFFRKYFPFFI